MTSDYGYLGVPDEIVVELGRVVVVAGRVEATGHEIAGQLALHANWNQDSWDRLSNDVRRRINQKGLPDCSTVAPDVVNSWFKDAQEALGRRNVVIHSYRYRVLDPNGAWLPETQHIKTGDSRADSAEDIAEVRGALEDLRIRGAALHSELVHQRAVPHDPYRRNYPECG